MKIVILGAGQVGVSVAEALAGEANDITLVDNDAARLRKLQDRLDIRTLQGHASHPNVLEDAGIEDADMLLAVTNSDETNMMACQVAYSLYRTPTKIARVRALEYSQHRRLFCNEATPVDFIISPEQLVTDYIRELIDYPGALQVLDFAAGRVKLVAIRAYYGGPMVGHQLRQLRRHMPDVDPRVAAIFRHGQAIQPEGDTVIEPGDEVFFLAATKDIRQVMGELRRLDTPNRRILLAGGGNIGRRLARAIEDKYLTKLIEKHPRHAGDLAAELNNAIVLVGDAADKELLLEENIEDTDVFAAVTNDDQANILSAMLAKQLGVKRTITLINRPAYVDLVEGSEAIDVAVSPSQATIGSLLAHIRRADVARVHALRRGAAEAIEAVAHGDPGSSPVVGRRVGEIKLPQGAAIGAVVRGEHVVMGHHDTLIAAGDHVILFLTDKRHLHAVERLFQVAPTFF